jgi:hypothetical protein
VKLTGKILLTVQILIFAIASIGISVNFHTCLTMGKSDYSINYFNNHGCCGGNNLSSHKEATIQHVCCSNQEQNIQLTSIYTGEKSLKLNAIDSLYNITHIIPSIKGYFNVQSLFVTVFINPPPLFISQKNIRC